MSEMIVQVRNKILRRIGGVNHFVSHNKDYTIQFQFDESWNNVRTKMAVFAYEDGEYGSEIFDGDTCNVPELPKEGRILIGVKAGEDLSTELLCIPVCKSADDVITDEYDEPDPKIYEQILDIINNLWNGGTTVYPSPVKFLASPSTAKVGDLIRVKEVDENGDVTRTEGFDVGVELEKKINAPQVAKVGEVLTVEEVDADGKPKKWKTQTVETAPPDWMENVSNNPGFVKNRTHYKQMMAGPAGNPGYKVNLLDGTHRVGDIILLQSLTTNSLQKFLMQGINSPDWGEYELCMLIKETDSNGKTYNLEVICKDSENIVEVNTLSEGNIKVLYSEQAKAFLAYYFISNLSTLSTDDKTKFTQTGVYIQLVGKDYSEYAELWATYRLYLYSKLSNKYLNIRQDPPDWNENDPTKPGYIENRTHYFKVTKTEIGSILFKATSSSALVMENPEDTKLVRAGITKVANEHSNIVEAIVDGNPYKFYVETTMGVTMLIGVDNDSNGWAYDGPAGMNQQFEIGENVSLVVGNKYNVMFYWRNEFCKTLDEMYFPKTIFTQNNSPVKFGTNEYGDIIGSTIQGIGTVAQGPYSHAEGAYTKARGEHSHAEGNSTKSQKSCSHAEGFMTTANGDSAHAEGSSTQANHRNAHAEGDHTIASGECSHAEGYNTIASGKEQHAQGKYNIEDTVSAHIVGNGESNSKRSNAYTLDWEGNAWFAGNVYVGSTSGTNKDDGSKKLLDTSDLLAFEEKVKDVTIQKPTTAQVGQIIKVKAVDADGKITETEAVDMNTSVTITYNEETGNLQIGG